MKGEFFDTKRQNKKVKRDNFVLERNQKDKNNKFSQNNIISKVNLEI